MSKKKATNSQELVQKKYSIEEKRRIAQYKKRCANDPVKFCIQGSYDSPIMEIQATDKDMEYVKLMEALGTADNNLQRFLLYQAIKTFHGCIMSEGLNFERLGEFANITLSILQGIAPKDEVEGMLAIQMVGVHNLAMETLKNAMITGQTFEARQANVNHATKLLRTFISQADALTKYRTGGEQRVTVEHVHVNKGGQAIVGTVNQGGCKNEKCE